MCRGFFLGFGGKIKGVADIVNLVDKLTGFVDILNLVDKIMILVDKIFNLMDIPSCFVDKV